MGPGERLDSWKAIAAYMKRDERTVRRWEKEGLPVRRLSHTKKVYAYASEIDAWWQEGRTQAAVASRRRRGWLLAAAALLIAAGTSWLLLGERSSGRPAASPITSIAVLPLANLSADAQHDYFADGMTEALIGELGKVSALRVLSRTSVMPYKNVRKPLAQIARELNADAVVEGAVVRERDRVRVTVKLMRTRPEAELWSARYERDITSVLALQRDIARIVAAEIHATLTPQEKVLLAGGQAVNAASYEAYLKGRYHWNKASGAALFKAREHFEEAISNDPAFAPAYVGLANTYAWAYRWDARPLLPPREAFPKAKAAALKAIELDDTLAEAHASLAYIKEAYDWDWPGAERAYLRAIELNPSYAPVRHWYAIYLTIPGRFDEAFAQIKRAEELEPLSRAVKRGKGLLWLWSRQADRAIEQWRMTLELEPDFPQAHYMLAAAHAQKGMYDDAIGLHLKAISLSGETPRALAILAHAYGKAGRKREALRILDDLNERAKREYISGYFLAIPHVGLGNSHEALRCLEKAIAERDPYVGELNSAASFWFDEVRTDPQFKRLLGPLNFPT